MTERHASPPRLAEAWLERVLPPGLSREGLLGDLHEGWQARATSPITARLWYWQQALGVLRRHLRVPAGARRGASTEGESILKSTWQDVRYALRSLADRPGFTAIAVLTLALGIGANVALFSVVQAVVLNPLHYPDPDELVVVWQNDRIRGTSFEGASAPDFSDWLELNRSFEGLVARTRVNRTLGGSEPTRVRSARVSAAFFSTLGVRPLLGRDFAAEEELPGQNGVVLLSESLWRSRFGADPGVLGRAINVDGDAVTVVGVMPVAANLASLINQDLWEPLAVTEMENVRGRHMLLVIGRLGDGVTVEAAQKEMTAIMARLEALHPDDNLGRGAVVVPLHEQIVGDVKPALMMLFGAVGLVLLIACANVAHLSLARGLARARELAIRQSLGASAARIARQLVTESLVLASVGGAAGLVLAIAGVRVLKAAAPTSLPRLASASIDTPVLVFALAASALTGLVFGILPALRATRRAPRDDLAEGGHSAAGSRATSRQLMLVVEVALAVVLVVGAGLLVKSLSNIQTIAPGYQTEKLLIADFELKGSRYEFPKVWPVHDWPEYNTFTYGLIERLEATPGIAAFALAQDGPTSPGWTTRVTVEGRPETPAGEQEEAYFRPVSPDYFATLGVPLRQGRSFTTFDTHENPLVAIVNESFVRRHFPGERPVGQSINVFGAPREIVGTVGDIRFQGLATAVPPAMYLPLHQNPLGNVTLIVRAEGDPMAVLPTIRRHLGELDAEVALFGITTADAALASSLDQRRFNTTLLMLFAGVALTLAMIGVYGVLSYSVAQRTREMGVRLALGADPRAVVKLVLAGGIGLVATALVLGIVASLFATRALESLLFGVAAGDAGTLAAVAALLGGTALLACYVPARRASRVDPLVSLRSE